MSLKGIEVGNFIAINQAVIRNQETTFEKIFAIAPKVCVTTANHPGFLGFHALVQTGAHSMAGRFGGAKMLNAPSMEALKESLHNLELNPINLWQYTVWESSQAHEEMHYQNFDRIFEFCTACLNEVVEGPYEPVYEVKAADMPKLMDFTDVPKEMMQSMANNEPTPKIRLFDQRVFVNGIHKIKEGHEEAFLDGVVEVMQMLQEHAAGMVGWMILEKIGESAYGPMQMAPKQFWETIETLGANPPKEKVTIYGEYGKDFTTPPGPAGSPKEYIVHMEWSSLDTAQFGVALAAVNPKVRKVHDEKVMVHLAVMPPYYKVFAPIMEDMVFFH